MTGARSKAQLPPEPPPPVDGSGGKKRMDGLPAQLPKMDFTLPRQADDRVQDLSISHGISSSPTFLGPSGAHGRRPRPVSSHRRPYVNRSSWWPVVKAPDERLWPTRRSDARPSCHSMP
ncbi:hypothetical protein DCS_02073 [Drechmeria coniospora]|uniref:Uncharacterized protein n=1 Tax=Drechmeria coniospora TaxID=98403 RepID=A0A151GV41_DRECN|nr:hypothetical protein DCS_02073 [Drechmeria coniospora]KYK60933.1 hypothetical protein DCS_02073 [Drechmeria coniospora]